MKERIEKMGNESKKNENGCNGGIIGMGEQLEDRAGMLVSLTRLSPQPEITPINVLVPVYVRMRGIIVVCVCLLTACVLVPIYNLYNLCCSIKTPMHFLVRN